MTAQLRIDPEVRPMILVGNTTFFGLFVYLILFLWYVNSYVKQFTSSLTYIMYDVFMYVCMMCMMTSRREARYESTKANTSRTS